MEIIDRDLLPGKQTNSLITTLNTNGVPLPIFIPKTTENHFFYKNGLSKIIPRINVKVHSQIDECYDLWEKFTPKKTLYDEWDFRYAWYKAYEYKPYFYTLYEGGKPLGVLPLWFDEEKKRFEIFGSYWQEDNSFFVEDEKFIDLLFAIAPTPVYLGSLLSTTDWTKRKVYKELEVDDPKNIKDITKYSSMDEMLSSFGKKERYNLRSDFNHIQSMNPQIKIIDNYDEECLSSLIKLNIERFQVGQMKEESDMVNKQKQDAFRYMSKYAGAYKTKFIEVYVQGYLAGIDFVIQYKDIYYTVKSGNDINRFKGIGNYLVYYEFEDALKKGYRTVDAQQEDWGWKHRYFDQIPMYCWEIKDPSAQPAKE